MNIKKFKVGDIITRNKPCIYDHNDTKDSSYCGDRLVFKGHDETSKIIFLESGEAWNNGDVNDLSYARDGWDEGWCLYPETMWQKINKVLSSHSPVQEGNKK
jgi:hypothetical protein